MIGDDRVDTQFGRALDDGRFANPRIDADQEPNVVASGLLDDVHPHAVAVMHAMRHMKLGAAAGEFDCRPQHDYRACAVDIIVAVNQNAFMLGDGRPQALDGGAHAEHAIGVVKVRESRVQEALGVLGSSDGPLRQQPRGERADLQLGSELIRRRGIGVAVVPSFHRVESQTREASRVAKVRDGDVRVV